MDRCTGGATLGACVLLTLRVGCIGLSGHDPHPSRVSLEAGQFGRMATWHVERVGRVCCVDHGWGLGRGLTVRQVLSCVRLAIIVVASAITPKTRGAALFRNVRTRRTPLCTLIFDIRVLETSCACQKRQWKCASTASTNEPTPHALAPLRPARHPANMLIPIGFVVVTWRRCRASARTYAQRMDSRTRWSEV